MSSDNQDTCICEVYIPKKPGRKRKYFTEEERHQAMRLYRIKYYNKNKEKIKEYQRNYYIKKKEPSSDKSE